MKSANTVGINVRTIGSFWKIVPYVLTLPAAQNAIHILPVWEPGVVASLYGPSSWNINPEFFDPELAALFPQLDTVEKQLKAVVNLLHLGERAVGMDVVPHTDRFSEMAVANPHIFEWLQRRDLEIVRHDSGFYREVQRLIFDFVKKRGSAVPGLDFPDDKTAFFESFSEEIRLKVMFGHKNDYTGRLQKRKEIVQMLFDSGIETVPATMGPPYRGIEVDPHADARVVDEDGRVWLDYRIARPQAMSRVFGPLSRYKLYESKAENRHWELDFERPNTAAWDYVCNHYCAIQKEFGFDFMRGDMSHVQMRPEGVPAHRDRFYDLLGAVKQAVLRDVPSFAYFAESFLAPPDTMAYGDECDHLEASFADSTLGNLQSEPVGTQEFVSEFARYCALLHTRKFAPNFTLMTADKDDPRFDGFYLEGNEIRYFLALFLTDMPSYVSLGFECRMPHHQPAPNEHYTKLYVFQMKTGPKATQGPYQWERNMVLYNNLARQKELSETLHADIRDAQTRWLIAPDASGQQKVIAWTQSDAPRFIFVANLDTKNACRNLSIPNPGNASWRGVFSTEQEDFQVSASAEILIEELLPGEGLVFRDASVAP